MVYARISNVYETQKLMIAFAGPGGKIWEAEAEVGSDDPLEAHTLMFPMPASPISAAGRYVLTVESRNDHLATTPIKIYSTAEREDEP